MAGPVGPMGLTCLPARQDPRLADRPLTPRNAMPEEEHPSAERRTLVQSLLKDRSIRTKILATVGVSAAVALLLTSVSQVALSAMNACR